MQCAYCGMANPAQARFCLHCGQALVTGVVCQTCFTLLPRHARFCFHCGAIVIPTPQTTGVSSSAQTDVQPATSVQVGSSAHAIAMEMDAASGAASLPQYSSETLIIGQLPTPRPLYEMLDSLRRYLPPSLYEPMERRSNERQLEQVRDHLRKLLATTRTYLPQPVFLNPQPPGEPTGAMQRGVFLFVDVSGFTPLSEQLRRFGNLGAERITTIINDLFSELVTILFNHGGILLKYGGDALLGLWEAASDEDMSSGALLAAQTAWAMQNIMQKFASIDAAGENYTLRVKIGISAGPYFAAHIGTKNNMAYITTGHTVNRAEEAQGKAAPGDIIITQSTRDWLDKRAQMEPIEAEGYFIVRGVEPLEHSLRVQAGDELAEGSVRAQITYLVERMDRLSPYLPEELIARIVTNPEDTSLSPDHRPVTIIFANYVGLSNLIEDLGSSEPDVITYQLNRYFTRMAEIVERYEGTLARMDQYAVGDRLIIFFGAPRAHEDDPVRAVYTALEIQRTTRDDFSALKSSKGIYRFQQRIGINTGYVFAGNIGAPDLRQEYTLMGDDINTAARLMAKAPWQSILISKKTHQRVANFFETKDWGELKVKGKAITIPTYEVLDYRDETTPETEFASSTPLIGRDEAAKKLLQAGQGFLKERGQILFIMGEGGMGKSRILRILRDWLHEQKASEKLRWLEVQALSFSEQISYWLAQRMLLAALNLTEDTRSDDLLFALWDKGEKLLGKETAREATPFLAYMMNLPLEGAWAEWIHELDPEVRQKQTFWAAREFFTALAKEQPIIMVVDELHWGDEPSLALLENLLEMAIHVPLLFIFVFRPKREKGCWRLRERAARDYHSRCTEIELLPLTRQQSGELLAQLLPGAVFTSQAQEDILSKTAGNPYYLQEVVRSLIDSGSVVQEEDGKWRVTAVIDEITIPDTLQGAILARIDRLTEDTRQALQMAAVIGRRFRTQVLRSISEAKDKVDGSLAQLERDEMILPADSTSNEVYDFLDALVQEVAYENLLTQRRQVFHRRVGLALEELLADRIEQECELLAFHFRLSDDKARAIQYLEMAGRKAQAEFANETALNDYTELLELLDLVDDRSAAWEKRFEILRRRQQVYGLLARQTAREGDLRSMLMLADQHNDIARRADTLNAQADLYQWTGRYGDAQAFAQEALELKTALGDTVGQADALHQLGVIHYVRGDYVEAAPLLRQAIELRRAVQNAEGEAWSAMYLGMIDFAHGSYEQAAARHERALELAQARQDIYQVGIHLTNAARVHLRLGEFEQALEQFQQGLELKRRVGDRVGQGFNLFSLGTIAMYLGNFDEADRLMRESLALRRDINDERGVSFSLNGLGLLALKRSDFDGALRCFGEAYEISSRLGLRREALVNLSCMSLALLGMGRHEEALDTSEEALARMEQVDVQQPHWLLFNHFRVLSSQSDPEAAAYLQRAYDALMTQADSISHPEVRQTFLQRVEENRLILDEADSGRWQIHKHDRALSQEN